MKMFRYYKIQVKIEAIFKPFTITLLYLSQYGHGIHKS